METVNLCNYPWIPVAGEKERKSLLQIFADDSASALAGNPVDKIVILRLLLCIVHASNKIPDLEAWKELSTEKIAQNATRYLLEHKECFELYGKRPFLQFPKLAEMGGKGNSEASLIVNVADGNKVILTGWNQYHGISESEKIILLLRSSCYACGGKKFDKTLSLTKGLVKGATGRCGTLLGFKGYLHAYLKGKNILDTLRLNILTEEEIRSTKAFSAGLGSPFWENMPENENGPDAKKYKNSYLGQLFPLDKFLCLTESGIIKTDGIHYPGHKENLIDPALNIYSDGKDFKATWAQTEKHPWRELPAILAFIENKQQTPYFLSMGLYKMKSLSPDEIKIWVGGAEVSSNSGEQYFSGKNDYVESEFSIPTEYIRKIQFGFYKELMQNLDQTAKRLYACVSGYYKKLQSDNAQDIAGKATTAFWDILSSHAQKILDLAFSAEKDSEEIKEEKRFWFNSMCQVYDEFCPHETPRQIEAWVEANPRFQHKKSGKEKK